MELFGEGNFKLGDIKKIETTNDFDNLDEDKRDCQLVSTYEECVTKKYLETLKIKCDCLPYNLQNYSSSDKEVYYCYCL